MYGIAVGIDVGFACKSHKLGVHQRAEAYAEYGVVAIKNSVLQLEVVSFESAFAEGVYKASTYYGDIVFIKRCRLHLGQYKRKQSIF